MNDWRLDCVARIEAVRRDDLDKSGRNPKLKLHLRLRLESWRAEAPDADVGEVLTVGIMDRAVPSEARPLLVVGQRVAVEARASGIRPPYAQLVKIARADGEP